MVLSGQIEPIPFQGTTAMTQSSVLKDFGTSIIDIGHRASAIFKDLCTREDSISRAHLNLIYASKAAREGKELRRQGAIVMAKCDHEFITSDCNNLVEFVTKHGDYLPAEDHITTREMERRKYWLGKMGLITEELSLLITTVNSNIIPHTEVDIRK